MMIRCLRFIARGNARLMRRRQKAAMNKIYRFSAVLSLLLTSVVSDAAPFDAARTISGAPFNSNGEVTVVHYWATWCAPCRLEMPVLDAYYRKHHAQGLAMLAISIDQGVSTGKLQQVTGKFAF